MTTDDDEFTQYVGARWPTLVRTAILLGCSPHEAEDVTQAALVKCLASWDKVRRAGDRDAYVYRVLVNTHTDSRRRRWWSERPSAVLPERADPDDATSRIEVADAVTRALDALTPPARAVVVLRYYAHLGEQQTAAVLGVPAGTVKSRLSRALDQLAADDNLADLRGRRHP